MLNLRTQNILEAVIRDFIKTGVPVSSRQLFKDNKFDIQPATIRAELNKLTKLGFLKQLHTSGGRIPTNLGYKFFVEKAVKNEQPVQVKDRNTIKGWFNIDLDNFIQEVSGELQLLGVGYQPRNREVYKSGLEELITALDFETKEDIFNVINDFEKLDERVDKILNYLDGVIPRVFIGGSPITKSENLSVIADVFNQDDDRQFALIAIGPKRMNYEKVIGIFKALQYYGK